MLIPVINEISPAIIWNYDGVTDKQTFQLCVSDNAGSTTSSEDTSGSAKRQSLPKRRFWKSIFFSKILFRKFW